MRESTASGVSHRTSASGFRPDRRRVDRHRYVRTVICDQLLHDLDRLVPEPEYRRYLRWALSGENPKRDLFTRIMAINQLADLTTALLTGIGGPDDWSTLVGFSTPVNVYQVFEVVSDNIALGLAGAPAGVRSEQRELLMAFDAVAVADLAAPAGRPVAELIAHLREPAGKISGFEQSLAREQHSRIARHYGASTGAPDLHAVEHSVWSGLVANLESSRDLLATIAGTQAEPVVRAGTVARYEAVDTTLISARPSRADRARTSARTILVAPTLAYFAGIFCEVLGGDAGYVDALADGTLLAAFDTASLLVRLQNDIGTPLLRMSMPERAALLEGLPARFPAPTASADTVVALLTRASAVPQLNRFRKDLLHGEFNVCLDEVHGIEGLAAGMAAFRDALEFFVDLYAGTARQFAAQLAELDRRLSDRRTVVLARRFVDYHESLYVNAYDGVVQVGDYAI